MKLSLIIQAADRASRPLQGVSASARRLVTRIRAAGASARFLDRVSSAARRLGGSLRRAANAALRFAGRMGLRAIQAGALAAARSLGSLAGTALQVSLAAASAGFGLGIAGVISLGSKFEQFQVVLENTEGSAEGARKAMAWVREFAKKTPYEVEKVMEAFVALKSYGLDPTNGSLEAMGNGASGMNKDLMQAVEMLADAQTGEFERLKEFGIVAADQGDKVSFAYQKAGKGVTKVAKKNATEIQKALVGIFDDSFKGMMDRQSRTLGGIWSNIKDQVAGFQLDVANAGFFDFVKERVSNLLKAINVLAGDGTLKKYAEQISAKLLEMGRAAEKFILETNWKKVGSDLSRIVDTLGRAVRFMTKMSDLAQKMPAIRMMNGTVDWLLSDAPKPGANYTKPKVGAPGLGGVWAPRQLAPKSGPYAPRGAAKVQKMSGQVDVVIRAAPGLLVNTSAKSSGPVKTVASRGRSMAGFA